MSWENFRNGTFRRSRLSRSLDFAWTELSHISYVSHVCIVQHPRTLARESRESARAEMLYSANVIVCFIRVLWKGWACQHEQCISRSYKVSRWTSRSSRLDDTRNVDDRVYVARFRWLPDDSRIGLDCLSVRACTNRLGDKGRTKILKDYGDRWRSCMNFIGILRNREGAQRATKLIRKLISYVTSI